MIVQYMKKNGINFDGFIILFRLFLDRGRVETIWTILKRFGYKHIDNKLELREDFFEPGLTELVQTRSKTTKVFILVAVTSIFAIGTYIYGGTLKKILKSDSKK